MLRFKTFSSRLLKIKSFRNSIFLNKLVSKKVLKKRIDTGQKEIYYECYCVPYTKCRNKLECLSSM